MKLISNIRIQSYIRYQYAFIPSIKDKLQSCFASRICSFFQENFLYGFAMKILLKKNAAANGLGTN